MVNIDTAYTSDYDDRTTNERRLSARPKAVFLYLKFRYRSFMVGSRELNKTPKGNKLRHLSLVVEARPPTKRTTN